MATASEKLSSPPPTRGRCGGLHLRVPLRPCYSAILCPTACPPPRILRVLPGVTSAARPPVLGLSCPRSGTLCSQRSSDRVTHGRAWGAGLTLGGPRSAEWGCSRPLVQGQCRLPVGCSALPRRATRETVPGRGRGPGPIPSSGVLRSPWPCAVITLRSPRSAVAQGPWGNAGRQALALPFWSWRTPVKRGACPGSELPAQAQVSTGQRAPDLVLSSHDFCWPGVLGTHDVKN